MLSLLIAMHNSRLCFDDVVFGEPSVFRSVGHRGWGGEPPTPPSAPIKILAINNRLEGQECSRRRSNTSSSELAS